MSILVSGSLALDHIMVFPDRFKEHILPDKIHILNVSFNIAELKTHFGGVAGNIAYHLKLLGEDPLILATAGSDFGPYADWLDRNGIRRDGIRVLDDVRTAQGFVTTDLDDNQIWAFYMGAMARAHEARLADLSEDIDLAIVTSDNPRSENPLDIIREVVDGMKSGSGYLVEPDRRAAIKLAVSLARPGDAILIAGKGHESVQIFQDGIRPFDDRRVAREILTETVKHR